MPDPRPVPDAPRQIPVAPPARRLAWTGVVLSLLPWLLIAPLQVYQMDFMLYTWIWPAVLGAAGSGAGLLALRLGAGRTRVVAGTAVVLGLLALLTALAGFGGMLARMGM